MDHKAALDLLEPHSHVFLDFQLQAYQEFDSVCCIPSDPTIRISVEGARPKFVNERINYLLEMHYGLSGSVRMIKQPDNLRYLHIEGSDFNLRVRAKKVDDNWRSSNHDSGQQDALRSSGLFEGCDIPTYHLMLAYRDTRGLQPAISHVAITHESKFVSMIRLLWTASAGVVPFSAQEIQQSLDLPEPTKIRRRRKDGESTDDQQEKKQG